MQTGATLVLVQLLYLMAAQERCQEATPALEVGHYLRAHHMNPENLTSVTALDLTQVMGVVLLNTMQRGAVLVALYQPKVVTLYGVAVVVLVHKEIGSVGLAYTVATVAQAVRMAQREQALPLLAEAAVLGPELQAQVVVVNLEFGGLFNASAYY